MTHMAIRDASLFVKVTGQGYPLLLMHGGLGQDHTSLLAFRELADQFTVILYDHRCNGHSEGADLSSLTWENLTADAEALREKLGFERWAVLGHSFGGHIALEYALRYPDSLSHLILMNTGGNWRVQQNGAEILGKRGYSEAAVQAARRFFSGQVGTSDYFTSVAKFARAYFYRISLPGMMLEMIFGPHPKYRPEATRFGYSQVLKDWTVMDRLIEIKLPALVLAGRWDFLFPPEHQAILADRLPNSQLLLVERAGHNPHLEQRTEVMQAVRNFLSSTQLGLRKE